MIFFCRPLTGWNRSVRAGKQNVITISHPNNMQRTFRWWMKWCTWTWGCDVIQAVWWHSLSVVITALVAVSVISGYKPGQTTRSTLSAVVMNEPLPHSFNPFTNTILIHRVKGWVTGVKRWKQLLFRTTV